MSGGQQCDQDLIHYPVLPNHRPGDFIANLPGCLRCRLHMPGTDLRI
jgi:hypothetical protein